MDKADDMKIGRPQEGDFGEYYKGYISTVPGEDALSVLEALLEETTGLLEELSADQWEFKYAPGKWSVKDMILHLVDSERIFAYRLLRLSRKDATPMPGFEQDDYVPAASADDLDAGQIIEQYGTVRAATLSLLTSLRPDQLDFRGEASGAPITGRALAWIMAGHEIHHLNVLKERYLSAS
jgi:uncharacterized damage-inducible protein DinB